jgi:DNA-binding transcriptional LysR family regulator
VFDLIERGEIDVAFTDFPLPSGAFESRTIARDPCSLLVRAGSDLASELEPPTVDRLARTPLVMLDGARSTAALETWFAAQGAVPNVALRATGEATLRAFVAAGLAGAIVPRLAVEPWDERIVAIDLEGVVPDREIAIYWRAGGVDGKALAAFSEAATKVTSGNPAGAGGGRVELAAA